MQAKRKTIKRKPQPVKESAVVAVLEPPNLCNKARMLEFLKSLLKDKKCAYLKKALPEVIDFIDKRV